MVTVRTPSSDDAKQYLKLLPFIANAKPHVVTIIFLLLLCIIVWNYLQLHTDGSSQLVRE